MADRYTLDELHAMREKLCREHLIPPEERKGSIYLYPPKIRKKLDDLAWAVTYKLAEAAKAKRPASAGRIEY